jgi:hypothetical protein
MRMAVGPWNFRDQPIGGASDSADLQPSKDHVKFRRATDEAERASSLVRAAETSEKEKEVAGANLLLREMTLRGGSLPEDRTPSWGTSDRVAAQIGIEMRAVASPDSASRQVFDDLCDCQSVERRNLRVCRRRSRIGNRKRAQLTVQDWARASAVRRVESLAAEYEFHLSPIAPSCYISRRTHDKENSDDRF